MLGENATTVNARRENLLPISTLFAVIPCTCSVGESFLFLARRLYLLLTRMLSIASCSDISLKIFNHIVRIERYHLKMVWRARRRR
jgi:hypothetical protein